MISFHFTLPIQKLIFELLKLGQSLYLITALEIEGQGLRLAPEVVPLVVTRQVPDVEPGLPGIPPLQQVLKPEARMLINLISSY